MQVVSGKCAVALLDDFVELRYEGSTAVSVKRRNSPRLIPVGAIDRVEVLTPPNPRAIGYLRLHLHGRDGYAHDVTYDLNALPFRNDSTDQILALAEAIEHRLDEVPAIDSFVSGQGPRPGKLREGAFTQEFAGVILTRTEVRYGRDRGPVIGAVATVDESGQISERMTLTRTAIFGVLAFGMKKREDHRQLYLSVTGRGYSFVVPVAPTRALEARRFAAQINAASRQGG